MHKISDVFEFRPDRPTDYGVRLIMGKCCLHASSFIFDRITIKVAGKQDRHKSSYEFDFGPLVSMAHLYVFFSSPEPLGSQGELIVYPYSGVRCRRQQCLNIFSSETTLPIKAKFYVEPPWEGGTKVLYKWSRSHDQDGRHAHKW